MAPIIEQWLDRMRARGISPEYSCAMLASEALALASVFHVGSDDAFIRMARSAIKFSREPPPTEH